MMRKKPYRKTSLKSDEKANSRDYFKLFKRQPDAWIDRKWSNDDWLIPGKAEKKFNLSRKDRELLRKLRNRNRKK